VGIRGERRCSEDDPFRGSRTLEHPNKTLYDRPTNFRLPPFRLDVDEIESKPVFADDAVDAAIPASATD